MNNKFGKDEQIGLFCDNLMKGGESILELIENKNNEKKENNEIIENYGIKEKILDKVFKSIVLKIQNELDYNYKIIEEIKKLIKN